MNPRIVTDARQRPRDLKRKAVENKAHARDRKRVADKAVDPIEAMANYKAWREFEGRKQQLLNYIAWVCDDLYTGPAEQDIMRAREYINKQRKR